ncbi:hypothetical protein SRHO_G00253880 [Serrasalmus rhombeus]
MAREKTFYKANAARGQDIYANKTTRTRTESTGSRCSRLALALMCVALLCVLLLTTIIVFYKYYINMNEEKKSLSQTVLFLTAERKTLLLSVRNLTEESDQLKSSYQNLTKEKEQMDKAMNAFKDKLMNVAFLTEGWNKFGSRYYYFSTEEMNWNKSRQACREREADLVVINSAEEQKLIMTGRRDVWIGLSDEESEGQWKWVDGSALTTQFWRSGEPNNANGVEHCAMFLVSSHELQTWNDARCSVRAAWVCESTLPSAGSLQ